jgi:integrase
MDQSVKPAAKPVAKQSRKTLNDRTLKALKPAAKGKTYDAMDSVIGFGVRVSETGRKTFMVAARYPGSGSYVRRKLGTYPAMSLIKARAEAKTWLELISQGKDPKAEEARKEALEQRKRENSFRLVAEAYVREAVIGPKPDKPIQRKAGEAQRIIDKEFIARWGGQPVAEITEEDVEVAINAVKARGAPGQARNTLVIAKTLFGWAFRQRRFGLTINPCVNLRAKDLIGTKASGDRILNDAEIAAFWRNADRLTPTDPRARPKFGGRLGYPYGPVYKMLLLTGLRLNEVADATWDEFDIPGKIWTIPKERMKGRNHAARAHAVPLTDDLLAILDSLPRFKGSKYLFSNDGGANPIWITDKVKKRLDRRMERSLRALKRMRGEEGDVQLKPWINHDLRRTLRSGLSRLRIDHDVKEAILAHAKPGQAGTYDRYDLFAEKRDALIKWAALVRELTTPAPDNVVKLSRA